MHAIVFEAVAVAISLKEPELLAMGVALLAKFLSVCAKAANMGILFTIQDLASFA